MKRPRGTRTRPPGIALLLALLVAASPAGAAAPAGDELSEWTTALRTASGLAGLRADPVLARTAEAHARYLAGIGRISHRDARGGDALDRYRAEGGSAVRIGEIVGAAGSVAGVRAAWEKSPSHKAVVLSPEWTHFGWAVVPSGAARGCVMLFAREPVEDLLVRPSGGDLEIRGIISAGLSGGDAPARPFLFSGLAPMEPREWRPQTGEFSFLVPAGDVAGYLRLGYVTARGAYVLTDAITWPPGKGYPGDGSRSSGPGSPP